MANSLNQDLEKKYIVLESPTYKGTVIERVFFCESGFGCRVLTTGQAIFGKFVFDGDECRVEGSEVERLATEEEIKKAKGRYEKKS